MSNPATPKWKWLMGSRVFGGFQKFARTVVRASGHPMAFVLAIVVILLWLLTGPLFHFGNTWLLVIDTVANIITFLMIFLIRNAQNRESEAIQLKLDELIRANQAAQNTLLDIEELSEAELDRIKARFEQLARKARAEATARRTELSPVELGAEVVPGGSDPIKTRRYFYDNFKQKFSTAGHPGRHNHHPRVRTRCHDGNP